MKWYMTSCRWPANSPARLVTLPSGAVNRYSLVPSGTIGSLRRAAASASSSRVSFFSLASRTALAASHSSSDTTGGLLI